jgi:outer membrane biosynthesis protein TonB
MSKYYTSNWIQARSIGVFVSAGLHLIILGIILPHISGEEPLLKGKLQFRNLRLVTLTPEQQQMLPENSQPTNPFSNQINEPEIDTNSTPVISNSLPLPPSLDSETITLPPPEELPPPPSLESLPPPPPQRLSVLPVTPPPIPPELTEIINPREDFFNTPKVTEVEVIAETQPEIAPLPPETPVERENDLIASVQAKAKSLKYDPSDTRPAEVQKNYQSWMSWQEQDNPEKINWKGNYPEDGCIKKIEGKTIYGVLVNPEGEIINLHLIQSAGYSLLNDQAAEEIKLFNFPTGTNIMPYMITVEFNYHAQLCPSLGLSGE